MARADEAAFADVVRAHGAALVRTATLLAGDRRGGADLARTALARSRAGDSPAELRRLLVTSYLSPLRRFTRSEQVVESWPEQRDEATEALRAALRDLPPRVRTAVVLRYLDGLAEGEIARVIGCPVEQARAEVAEGVRALGDQPDPERPPEEQLTVRLHDLADVLVGADETPTPEAVLETYRQRGRRRAGLAVAAAAALAVAVGVPTISGAIAPSAAPAAATSEPPRDTGDHHGDADAAASASAAMWSAERSAAAAAAQAKGQPELEAVQARLPSSVALTSPAEWDRWLPEGPPMMGEASCPEIAGTLGAVLGQEVDYWTGKLPAGPGGCTGGAAPRTPRTELYDYAYVLDIGFLGDGTTAEDLGHSGSYVGRTRGIPVPCARLEAAGGLLVRCEGSTSADDASWTLVLPDGRGAGVWVLNAYARSDASLPSSDAFVALVGAAIGAYG